MSKAKKPPAKKAAKVEKPVKALRPVKAYGWIVDGKLHAIATDVRCSMKPSEYEPEVWIVPVRGYKITRTRGGGQ